MGAIALPARVDRAHGALLQKPSEAARETAEAKPRSASPVATPGEGVAGNRKRASRRRGTGDADRVKHRYKSNPKPTPAEVSSLLNAPPMLNDARSPICFE